MKFWFFSSEKLSFDDLQNFLIDLIFNIIKY